MAHRRFSGYRRDKKTGRWLSPQEQLERRHFRERVEAYVKLSAEEIRDKMGQERSRLAVAVGRSKQAATNRDEARAQVHAAVDRIRAITKGHFFLQIGSGSVLGYNLPRKIEKEPYVALPAGYVTFELIQHSVASALAAQSFLNALSGGEERLKRLHAQLPQLDLAYQALKVETLADFENAERRIKKELKALKLALDKRLELDEEAETKRRTAERRAFERARLAAYDEETRQVSAQYREKVPFSGLCAYCEEEIVRGENAHLDHIIPVSKGGLATSENLVWACDRCNLLKSDNSFHRFCQVAGLNAQAIVERLHSLGKFI